MQVDIISTPQPSTLITLVYAQSFFVLFLQYVAGDALSSPLRAGND